MLWSPDTDLEAGATNAVPRVPSWDKTVSARAALGYNDNLLLSGPFRESSPFLFLGLEASVWRLPVDGNEAFVFLNGEFTQYLPDREPENEQLLYLVARGHRQLSKDWKTGLELQSVYQYSVYDASATETNLVPLPVKGYLIGGTPEVRRELGKRWWSQLTLEGKRQFFDGQLDDFWQGGPRVTVGRNYARRSLLQLSYRYHWRSYDERSPPQPDGSSGSGKTLRYAIQEAELMSRHDFDAKRRWRLNSRLGFGLNQDNGSGYFDFARYQIREQLRYSAAGFTLQAHGRLSYYDYFEQTATGLPGAPSRYVLFLQIGARAEKDLGEKFAVFAEYDRDWNWSNRAINEYTANRVKGGVEWRF